MDAKIEYWQLVPGMRVVFYEYDWMINAHANSIKIISYVGVDDIGFIGNWATNHYQLQQDDSENYFKPILRPVSELENRPEEWEKYGWGKPSVSYLINTDELACTEPFDYNEHWQTDICHVVYGIKTALQLLKDGYDIYNWIEKGLAVNEKDYPLTQK